MVVFLVPSISLEENSLESFTTFSHWVIEKILAWGSCFLIWLLSAYLVTKNGTRNVSVFSIWLVGFLGGFFGCLVGEIFKNLLGVTFRLDFFQRMIYTSISCICVVMVTSVLGRDRRSFLFFKNEVRRSVEREQISGIRKSKIHSANFDSFNEGIESKLISIINKKSNQKNMKNLRLALRHFSHELFQGLEHIKIRQPIANKLFYSDFSYKLFLISIRNEPLNPNIFTMVISFFISMPLLRLENSIKSLIASLFVITTTLIIHNLQYFYWKSNLPVQLRKLLAFDVLNVLILIIEFFILKKYFGFYRNVTNEIFLDAMLVILYSFFYIFGHISRASDIARLNVDAVKDIEITNAPSVPELIKDEEYRIKLAWSKFVHAELQPYLLVMGLSSNPSSIGVQVTEIKSKILSFKDNLVFFAGPGALTLNDCFTSLNHKWDGLLNIISNTESISESTKISPQAILDLRDILSELAVNAVKHGGADILKVDVKSSRSNSLQVIAENNGTSLTKIKPGLGLSVFDHLCGNNWSLKNYDGMVVFTCRIYNN